MSQPRGIDWQAALCRHDRWLRTVVFARLQHRDAVDEVMQEVALAAVRQASPLLNPDKVAPWLYRLAVYQTLLYRRRKGRQRRLRERFAETVRHGANEGGDPLSWLIADERRELIRSSLARLPQRDAEILLLKYSENWNYRQIAEHLGISPSAVEARLHRARQRMRRQLASVEGIEVKP